jgi:hypothetical protein
LSRSSSSESLFRTYLVMNVLFRAVIPPVPNKSHLWDAPVQLIRLIGIHMPLSELRVRLLYVFAATRRDAVRDSHSN